MGIEAQNIKISVIIPVYNAAPFLRKAVESALFQEEVDEIILVEDGSTDESLDICESLEEEKQIVQLYRHPRGENRGAGASRNLGIMKAKNEWIAFLDADDYYLPNRFKEDKVILEKDPELDGAYNALGCFFYTKNDRIVQDFSDRCLTTMKEKVSPERLFFEMGPIGKNGYFHLDTLTIRKKVFERTGLFDPALRVTQDTHFLVRLAAVCSISPGDIENPVAVRGVHDGNRSTKDKIQQFQDKMFESLLLWGLSASLCDEKLEKIWEKFFKKCQRNWSNKASMVRSFQSVLFLFGILAKFPKICSYRFYWHSYPGVKRVKNLVNDSLSHFV